MTDYSKMTDEELNEAIAIKKGWVKSTRPGDYPYSLGKTQVAFFSPDYTHDWRLCGELITEMGDAISDGWELSCEHSDMDELEPLKWHVWMTRFTNDPADFRSVCGEADTPIRAFDICWLAWKEQE